MSKSEKDATHQCFKLMLELRTIDLWAKNASKNCGKLPFRSKVLKINFRAVKAKKMLPKHST